ncbi:MAG TPA: ARMT1-like domain-containing protein [Syntrophorhabdaceae bacterium]|nr:ARMT1-like domain-containing protein [Syntrophorhabdaceae bacterium]
MKVQDCCLACLKGLAEKTVRLSGGNDALIKNCFHLIDSLWHPEITPPAISNVVLKYIKSETGADDPYDTAKIKEFNEAVSVIDELRDRFESSIEGLIKLSALGNSADFFTQGRYNVRNFVFTGNVAQIENEIYIRSKDILILGDNVGDFIFDMPLVDHLEGKGKRVYYAVREKPVQNDLSLKDVREFGLDKIFARIVSTGDDEVGVTKEHMSGPVKAFWESGATVIAKGMGNFETISEFHNDRPVVYIMRVKCPAVAFVTGRNQGAYMASIGGE